MYSKNVFKELNKYLCIYYTYTYTYNINSMNNDTVIISN